MTTVTISLPESLREFVDYQIQSKGYEDLSEYLRGLLREAQQDEAKKREELLLLESLDDPRPDIRIDDEFWAGLKKGAVERAEQRKRRGTRQ